MIHHSAAPDNAPVGGPDNAPVGGPDDAPVGERGDGHGETTPPTAEPTGVGHLLELATARPRAALSATADLLASGPSGGVAVVAHQARGIALRELGRTADALVELRRAVRLASRAGADHPSSHDLTADVRASLAVTLVLAGRTAAGLAELDRAVAGAHGVTLARIHVRRCAVLVLLGRHGEGLAELGPAVRELRRAGDRVWEATALLNRSMCWIAVGSAGSAARADADAVRAGELFTTAGLDVDAAKAVHNRGVAAHLAGALPTALAHLSEAGRRYAAAGVDVPELAEDRCRVLLSAGLAVDALREVEDALARDPPPGFRLQLLDAASGAALSAGEPSRAATLALRAQRLARAQGRPSRHDRAAAVRIRARVAAGGTGAVLARDATRVAVRVSVSDPAGAPLAFLTAGRVALGPGCGPVTRRRGVAQLAGVAAGRSRGPALSRATGWLAEALCRERTGDGPGLLAACRKGLDTVDDHLGTLGATELRTAGTTHGRELAVLALREAVRHGDAAALLWWTERWRATALRPLPVRPPADPLLAAGLAALRDSARRLDAARADGSSTTAAEADRARAEAVVRSRRLETPAPLTPAPLTPAPVSHWPATRHVGGAVHRVSELVTGLAGVVLVELVAVDGTLHAVVVADGLATRCVVGSDDAALTEVAHARFALARAAHGRVPDLDAVGRRLQNALLGGVVLPSARPVVVVPPGPLLAAPWGLLPALAGPPVAVVPSAAAWLRSNAGLPGPTRPARRTVLVAGPGVPGSAAEISALVRAHDHPRVLSGPDATVDRVLELLDGAWLAHLVAHGSFRADNPLFSSLALADGPLTVHDLDRLTRTPQRVVLSACESADGSALGSDEVLGLVGALLGLGCRGVLAAVGPVSDAATTAVVTAVHRALLRGHDLPAALARARAEAAPDPLARATAASFSAFGS